MPELPAHKRARFEHELGLTGYDAAHLTMNRDTSDYFEQTAAQAPQGQSKLAANWVLGELSALLNRNEIDISQSPVKTERLASLLNRIRSEERRVGKECVSTCRYRWSPHHYKKNDHNQIVKFDIHDKHKNGTK